MELNDYQKQAMTTCMPSSDNFAYMMLNLVGEVGEFASKIAKAKRKHMIDIYCNDIEINYDGWYSEAIATHPHENDESLEIIVNRMVADFKDELKKECGDILWQIAGLAQTMGWSLEDIAQQNLAKLASRKQRNVIDGNGDNR